MSVKNKMNGPYTVEYAGLRHHICYEGDPIKISYGIFNKSGAEMECESLNQAFRNGIYKSCTFIKSKSIVDMLIAFAKQL